MIVVTGGAGFIGANLISELNRRGRDDIVLVESLSDGRKALNLSDCRIGDFIDARRCGEWLEQGRELPFEIDGVIHLGACSDTTEWDGRLMMDLNFRSSRAWLDYCQEHTVPLVYASSAAVYGRSDRFVEEPDCERPLNVYGYSKLAFDQHVRQRRDRLRAPVIGLRYFNVYGPREQHKQRMASVVWHFHRQLLEGGVIRLFEGSHGLPDGEQRRDFVHVDDVVDVTLWALQQPRSASGIYNCGTGYAESFNAVARAIVAWHGKGDVSYIPFPPDLRAAYQAYTQADLTRLRAAGYSREFRDVATGVKEYLDWSGS